MQIFGQMYANYCGSIEAKDSIYFLKDKTFKRVKRYLKILQNIATHALYSLK